MAKEWIQRAIRRLRYRQARLRSFYSNIDLGRYLIDSDWLKPHVMKQIVDLEVELTRLKELRKEWNLTKVQ